MDAVVCNRPSHGGAATCATSSGTADRLLMLGTAVPLLNRDTVSATAELSLKARATMHNAVVGC